MTCLRGVVCRSMWLKHQRYCCTMPVCRRTVSRRCRCCLRSTPNTSSCSCCGELELAPEVKSSHSSIRDPSAQGRKRARTWSRGARSATCSTARSSVVLMCTPANILSIFDRRSATCEAAGGHLLCFQALNTRLAVTAGPKRRGYNSRAGRKGLGRQLVDVAQRSATGCTVTTG